MLTLSINDVVSDQLVETWVNQQPPIKQLSINQTVITPAQLARLLSIPSLTTVSAVRVGLEDDHLIGLIQPINPNWQYLNIMCNSLTNRGFEALATALPHSNLISLNLRCMRMTNYAIGTLITALNHPQTKLTELILGGNYLSEQSLKALISVSYRIQRLSLTTEYRVAQVIPEIAEMLKHNCTLTELHLINCCVTADLAETLLTALKRNTVLHRLNLGGNYITIEYQIGLCHTYLKSWTTRKEIMQYLLTVSVNDLANYLPADRIILNQITDLVISQPCQLEF
jgi:Ran GTPase-activating protein (RanGAP) involved in mRNA processing and transport